MRRIILSIFFIFVGFALNAQESFRFNYSVGQKFHIDGIIDEEVYRNDLFIKAVRIRNIGDLTVTEISGEKALHEGMFDYYQSEGGSDFVHEETYPAKFFRDVYGNYEISNTFFMPVVRGVPTFPKTPLDVGDQWSFKAHEAHDFREVFGIENPVILPASVSYQYLGNVMIDGDNPHTQRTVALNRIDLRPGDIIDIRKIRDSERRLRASGLFLNDIERGVKPKIVFSPKEESEEVAEGYAKKKFRGQSPDPATATAASPHNQNLRKGSPATRGGQLP